jgi:hypothetical protein
LIEPKPQRLPSASRGTLDESAPDRDNMESNNDLSKEDIKLIKEVLNAAAYGPFIPDWEFHTLFGLYRDEVKRIADNWPKNKESDKSVGLAINNSFINLLGYPIDNVNEWKNYISITRADMIKYYSRWRSLTKRKDIDSNTSKGYFFGLE